MIGYIKVIVKDVRLRPNRPNIFMIMGEENIIDLTRLSTRIWLESIENLKIQFDIFSKSGKILKANVMYLIFDSIKNKQFCLSVVFEMLTQI